MIKFLKEEINHILDNDTMTLVVSVSMLFLRVALYLLAVSKIDWVKTYVKPILKYKECFDFCSFLLFVMVIFVLMKVKDNGRLYACVLINFMNTIVCWSYIPDIFMQAKKWISSFLFNIVKWYTSTSKHSLYFWSAVLLLVILYCVIRWKKIIRKYAKKIADHMRKFPVYWTIFSIYSIFILLYGSRMIGYLFDFKIEKIEEIINQLQIILILFSTCSMVYLCLCIKKSIKKGEVLPLTLIYFNFCFCIFGIFSIKSYINKLLLYLLQKKIQFSKWILAEIQMFLFIAILVVCMVLLILLIRSLRHISKVDKIIDFIKRIMHSFSAKQSISSDIITLIIGILFLILGMAIIITLLQWGMTMDEFFRDTPDTITLIGKISAFFGAIFLLAVFGILSLFGMALFIGQSLKKMSINNGEPVQWVILLISFILTGISFYIYNASDLTDWDRLSIAGNVFGVFSIPVILMAWYVIMNGIIASLIEILPREEIKNKIREEMKGFILSLITSIFTPFMFLVNFGESLREALLDNVVDNEETGTSENNNE